jgi:hypothetical protein
MKLVKQRPKSHRASLTLQTCRCKKSPSKQADFSTGRNKTRATIRSRKYPMLKYTATYQTKTTAKAYRSSYDRWTHQGVTYSIHSGQFARLQSF